VDDFSISPEFIAFIRRLQTDRAVGISVAAKWYLSSQAGFLITAGRDAADASNATGAPNTSMSPPGEPP